MDRMRKYVLLAHRQKDVEFQYSDFSNSDNLELLYFDYTKIRIRLLNAINMLGLKNTWLYYRLVLKRIFNNTIERKLSYDRKDEYVFIVMARVYEKYGSYLVSYLRENYPSCKMVIYLADLIHNMRFSLDEARKDFDIVCSFDEKESLDNNLYFVLTPFSTRLLDRVQKVDIPEFDVSFVGTSKGRLELIMWLYNLFTEKGLKCDFYIVGVEKKKQIQLDGIHYNWLDFENVLKHAARSRCLLEIMQKGGYSATARFAEAMLLGKNLITNCPALKNINEKNIIYFGEGNDFLPDYICETNEIDTEKYVEMFSIKTFLGTIAHHLSEAGF